MAMTDSERDDLIKRFQEEGVAQDMLSSINGVLENLPPKTRHYGSVLMLAHGCAESRDYNSFSVQQLTAEMDKYIKSFKDEMAQASIYDTLGDIIQKSGMAESDGDAQELLRHLKALKASIATSNLVPIAAVTITMINKMNGADIGYIMGLITEKVDTEGNS